MSHHRAQVVDFSTPVFWGDRTLALKDPNEAINYWIYSAPFR